jgi:hypothetical protein
MHIAYMHTWHVARVRHCRTSHPITHCRAERGAVVNPLPLIRERLCITFGWFISRRNVNAAFLMNTVIDNKLCAMLMMLWRGGTRY